MSWQSMSKLRFDHKARGGIELGPDAAGWVASVSDPTIGQLPHPEVEQPPSSNMNATLMQLECNMVIALTSFPGYNLDTLKFTMN